LGVGPELAALSPSPHGPPSKPALAGLFEMERGIKIRYGTARHPDQGRGPR
jgi:hypothetical protein